MDYHDASHDSQPPQHTRHVDSRHELSYRGDESLATAVQSGEHYEKYEKSCSRLQRDLDGDAQEVELLPPPQYSHEEALLKSRWELHQKSKNIKQMKSTYTKRF